MYCSSCGATLAPALSYCNHCGARVAEPEKEAKSSSAGPGTLVAAIVCTFVFGLVAITMLMGVMKVMLALESGVVLGFAMMCFLAMFALEAVFIRLLLRRKNDARELPGSTSFAGPVTKELNTATPQMLGEPLPSVTEHTTRTFEPTYQRRS